MLLFRCQLQPGRDYHAMKKSALLLPAVLLLASLPCAAQEPLTPAGEPGETGETGETMQTPGQAEPYSPAANLSSTNHPEPNRLVFAGLVFKADPDTPRRFYKKFNVVRVESTGLAPAVGFEEIRTDLTDSVFWDIDVGVKTLTWDYRHIFLEDITKFDGVNGFEVVLRAKHLKGPHLGAEQTVIKTHAEVKSKPPRSQNDTGGRIRAIVSLVGDHEGHKDVISADLRFRVGSRNRLTKAHHVRDESNVWQI